MLLLCNVYLKRVFERDLIFGWEESAMLNCIILVAEWQCHCVP